MNEKPKPVSRWSCWYEVRNIGAIGKFFPCEHVTYGHETVKEAMAAAFEFLQENYELRRPVKCNDLTGTTLAKAMRPEHTEFCNP